MSLFTKDVADVIIRSIQDSPESKLSAELRNKAHDFFAAPRKLSDVCDYLASISNKPLTEISGFMRTLCNVSEFYERPHKVS